MPYFGTFVIPVTLATSADYSAYWPGAAVPSNIDQILRACTSIILNATEGAFYAVDTTTGLATDATQKQAMINATCIQAAAWVKLGIDPMEGGVFSGSKNRTSAKIGSAGYVNDPSGSSAAAQAAQDAVESPVPDAMRLLQQNNLLGTHPWYYG